MSVVVKEDQTGKILLLSKGADESILPRSYPGTFSSNEKCITLVCHNTELAHNIQSLDTLGFITHIILEIWNSGYVIKSTVCYQIHKVGALLILMPNL